MHRTRIASSELLRSLDAVLDRVEHGHEAFVVEHDGKPVAYLTPVEEKARPAQDERL